MTTPTFKLAETTNGRCVLHNFFPLVRGYEWLASRQLLACAVVMFLALGLRAALLPWLPVPQPLYHDEFSYLLAAVLSQPTYISKCQPPRLSPYAALEPGQQ